MVFISVIIPTFNRFKYLLNTINSVKQQTFKNIEIIIVNDCSTEKEYYQYDWQRENVIIIHLSENSREKFGFPCPGYVRNIGISKSQGEFISFCDDDDIWFPEKLQLQINAMKMSGCKMSATEGLIGFGIYNKCENYKKYNSEHYYSTLQNIYKSKGSNILKNGFPKIWNLNFLQIHNCIICSSVVIEKKLLNKINNFRCLPKDEEDYDCWLRAMLFTNSVYVDQPCFYYDSNHGE
jgi:glycosyltransferase involved in cell wall biosynthesis